jgi:hypothetical protein
MFELPDLAELDNVILHRANRLGKRLHIPAELELAALLLELQLHLIAHPALAARHGRPLSRRHPSGRG